MTNLSTASFYINKIDDNYPISGQNNNIQGLKDNFKNIKLALSSTDELLSYINLNAAVLTNPINDFNNNIIKQAVLQDSSNTVYDNTGNLITDNLTVNYRNGSFQKFKFSNGNYNINISNWPGINKSGNLILVLYTENENTITNINFIDSSIVNLSNIELPFKLLNNGPNFFELFSDGTSGTTYVKYYVDRVNLSKPLNLANFSLIELASIPSSELKNGSLVFVTGTGYNKPAYYYNGNWYLLTGNLLS